MEAFSHTIVIGLGGTGHRVALQVKGKLQSLKAAIASRFRFLVFDTDEEPLIIRNPHAGGFIAMERERELFYLGRVPVARLRMRKDQYPSLTHRFPQLSRLPAIALHRGARQIRPLGALAFAWHFPLIRRTIRDILWDLCDRRVIESSPRLKIFIVTSLEGGTGSGMFLDMAYLLRQELMTMGVLAESSMQILVAVGPNAFHDLQGPNLILNFVASLIELNQCMMQGDFQALYPDGTEVAVSSPPFDRVFFIDAIDEAGYAWRDRESLYEMLAEALLVLAASPIGAQEESALENLDRVLSGRTMTGEGTFLSSFGVAALEFPATSVIDLLAAREARYQAEVLLRQSEGIAAEGAERWIRERAWGVESLLAILMRNPSGEPLLARLQPPAWLERLPDPEELAREARRYLEDFLQLRIEGDGRLAIEKAARQWGEEATQALEAMLERMAAHGLPVSQRFLELVVARSRMLQEELEADCQRWTAIEAQWRRRLEGEARGLGPLRPLAWPLIGWLLRHFYMMPVLRRVFAIAEALAQVRLRRIALENVRGALARFQDCLELRLEELQRWSELLREAAKFLEEHVDRLQRSLLDSTQPSPLRVLDLELLKELEVMRRSSVVQAELSILRAWQVEGAAVLAEHLIALARPAFAPLVDLSIEELLERRPEIPFADRYQALRQLARPAWLLDETAWPEGRSLVRLELLGVSDAAHTRFIGCPAQRVSTGDPHRVIALTIAAGAPMSGLVLFARYHQCYRAFPDKGMLHILPDRIRGEEP